MQTITKKNPSLYADIDDKLKDKYDTSVLFKEKFDWAVQHTKDRDIAAEIKELNKKK